MDESSIFNIQTFNEPVFYVKERRYEILFREISFRDVSTAKLKLTLDLLNYSGSNLRKSNAFYIAEIEITIS